MQSYLVYLLALTASFLISGTNAAYLSTGKNNIVYWGQGSGQASLATYCNAGNVDIAIISFVNTWNAQYASYNFGNACTPGTTCTQIEQDIATCQKLGVKVLVSIGGDKSTSTYGVSNDNEGYTAGSILYNMFHPNGANKIKPFGAAEIDGFDLDIENGNQNGLIQLVVELRKLWTTKQLIISAAPQCIYPDSNVFKVLQSPEAKIDIANVQFYNNPSCSFNNDAGFKQSWNTWYNFITTQSGNHNMKVYVGVTVASANAAYYVDPQTAANRVQSIIGEASFGGFSLWDAASGASKVTNGVTYTQSLKNIISGKSVTKRSLDGSFKDYTVIAPKN